MKISIVVPAFNEEKLIVSALTAMKNSCEVFTRKGWETELVVCDNNSSDRTAELAQSLGATVVFEPVNQISRARNRGASAATGEWIIFVDADSFPHAELFSAVAKRIETGRYAGGGCLVRLDASAFLPGILVRGWNLISLMTRWAAGSFVVCEAKLFRELGGFSDKLFASEEIEFSARLKKLARSRGLRVAIITEERLVTSARKMHLYGKAEHLRFFAKAILSPRRTIAQRESCTLWYDGRR